MITYGLVRQVGPKPPVGVATYRQDNIWEERPYWAQTKLLPKNDYEQRMVTDQNGYQALEAEVVNRMVVAQQDAMAKFNQSFGRVSVPVEPMVPPTVTMTQEGEPISTPPTVDESPVEIKTEGVDTGDLNSWSEVIESPVYSRFIPQIVSSVASSILPTAGTLVTQMGSQNRRMAVEAGLTLLFGPSAAPLIRGIRFSEDAIDNLYRGFSDYAINPLAQETRNQVVRYFERSPSEGLSAVINTVLVGVGTGVVNHYMSGPGMSDTLQYQVDAAPLLADPSQPLLLDAPVTYPTLPPASDFPPIEPLYPVTNPNEQGERAYGVIRVMMDSLLYNRPEAVQPIMAEVRSAFPREAIRLQQDFAGSNYWGIPSVVGTAASDLGRGALRRVRRRGGGT